MKSRYWLLAGVLLAGGVHAVPHYGPAQGPGFGPAPYTAGPMAGQQAGAPALALRAGMDKLLGFMGAEEKPSAEDLAGFLDSEIAPFFDFKYMAESAGGRLFERLDAQQQQSMVQDIKRSFLTKMTDKLGAYDRQQVRFLPPRGNDGRTAQVSVAVLNPGSYPARLDFRMYRAGDQWLVYDVAANGQSAIVHYRTQLMRQMQQQRMQQMRQMAPPMGPRGSGMPPPGYGPGPAR